jgi:hypothetical protein
MLLLYKQVLIKLTNVRRKNVSRSILHTLSIKLKTDTTSRLSWSRGLRKKNMVLRVQMDGAYTLAVADGPMPQTRERHPSRDVR